MSDMRNSSVGKLRNRENDSRKVALLKAGALVLAVPAILFWAAAFLFSYEPEVGYFVRGAVLPVLGTVMLALAALLALCAMIFLKKEDLPLTQSVSGNACFFVSAFAGFMSLFEAGFRIYNLVRTEDFLSSLKGSGDRLALLRSLVDILTVIVCVVCAYSFYSAAYEKKRGGAALAFGLFPVIRCICGILQIFFDLTVALNVPSKILTEVGLMAGILYFLAEDRFRFAEDIVRPSWYAAASVLALSFCGASGFSSVFFYFKYSNIFVASNTASVYGEVCLEGVFCLITFFYVLFRFFAYAASAAKAKTPAAEPAEVPAAGTTAAPGKVAEEPDAAVLPENGEQKNEK